MQSTWRKKGIENVASEGSILNGRVQRCLLFVAGRCLRRFWLRGRKVTGRRQLRIEGEFSERGGSGECRWCSWPSTSKVSRLSGQRGPLAAAGLDSYWGLVELLVMATYVGAAVGSEGWHQKKWQICSSHGDSPGVRPSCSSFSS